MKGKFEKFAPYIILVTMKVLFIGASGVCLKKEAPIPPIGRSQIKLNTVRLVWYTLGNDEPYTAAVLEEVNENKGKDQCNSGYP